MSGDFEGLIELGGVAAVEAAVMAGNTRAFCPNCGAKFEGPYCAHCGQERDTHRRTIANLLHDFFEDILSFDSRILRTARALVSRPGELTCAFREGRTRAYVPPIRLYFFVTLLFFLILSVSGIAILKLEIVPHTITAAEAAKVTAQVKQAQAKVKQQLKNTGRPGLNIQFGGGATPKAGDTYPTMRTHFFVPLETADKPVSPAVQKGLDRLSASFKKAQDQIAAENRKNGKSGKSGDTGFTDWMLSRTMEAANTLARNPDAVNGPLTTWIPRALFLLLPLFAGLLALFHWRQRKDFFFVDHLVFSLNVHSFAFVVLIAAVWLAQVLAGEIVGWLTLIALGAYLLLAMKRVYGQSWFWTGTKFAFLSFIYAVFFLLPALAAVIGVSVLEA